MLPRPLVHISASKKRDFDHNLMYIESLHNLTYLKYEGEKLSQREKDILFRLDGTLEHLPIILHGRQDQMDQVVIHLQQILPNTPSLVQTG